MPLWLRITIERNTKFFSLKKYVEPEYWDEGSSTVKKGAGNAQKLNHFIRKEITKVHDIILDLENQERPITFDNIIQEYKSGKVDFITFARKEIAALKGKQSDKKLREDGYMLNKLERYQSPLNMNTITYAWMSRYENHLRNTLGNGDNTVASNLKFIRTYLNLAIRQGAIKKHFLGKYGIAFSDGDRDFLTIAELTSLYELWKQAKLREDLQEVLRYFLFSCYAGGLRYKDVKNLSYDKIQEKALRLRTEKTKELVFVPLVDKALHLIGPMNSSVSSPQQESGAKPRAWAALGESKKKALIFKVFSNRITNRKLTEIIEQIPDIQKKITFHCARHTFATISLTIGIPMEVVQKLLDHKDIKTTQIYAKIVDELKVKEMQKWESV